MTAPPAIAILALDGVWYVAIALVAGLVIAAIALVACWRWGKQGSVLIRIGRSRRKVAFDGMLVVPGMHTMQRLDLTIHRIELAHRGEAAIASADAKPIEAQATFVFRLRPTAQAVENAIERFGIEGAGDEAALHGAFQPGLERSVQAVLGGYPQAEVYGLASADAIREKIADAAGDVLGEDFQLESTAIEYFPPVEAGQLADDEQA